MNKNMKEQNSLPWYAWKKNPYVMGISLTIQEISKGPHWNISNDILQHKRM
jgi:hypothetical protein